jgi:hypothetical protein
MLQVIALGFEGIVVLIFDFPAGAPDLSQRHNTGGGHGVVGHKAVLIQYFACLFMGNDQLQPIDRQGIVAIA